MSRIPRRAAPAFVAPVLTVLTVLTALVLAGCSSAAIEGQGSVVSPASQASPPITSFPSSADTPTDTPTATPTVSTSAPRPTRTKATVPPASGVQVCPSKSKPPFCYKLPAGFRDYSYLKTYGKGWQYHTLVSVGRHDLIEVLGSREKHSYDKLDNGELRSYFDKSLRAKPGHYSVKHAGAVKKITLDGNRGFEQHVIFTDGVHGDTTTVFRGKAVISLGCQSQDQAARVRAACSSVHHSIRIR